MISTYTNLLVSTTTNSPSNLSLPLFLQPQLHPQPQPQSQPQPQLPRKQWGSFPINMILFLFLFLFLPFDIMSKSILETHNLQDFTLGDHVWYLKPPTLPLRPQDVFTHVQPIDIMLHLPPGPSKTPLVSMPAPLPPTKTRGKATKTTTNTIYMVSSTSCPSVSSVMEYPPDLSRCHLRNDGEICKTTFSFTPFPLNHSVESILSIKKPDFVTQPCQ